MVELYSVTIHRKVVVTKYLDKKGRRTETYEQILEQTYCDLPLVTANGYLKLDPNARIEKQKAIFDPFQKPLGNFVVRGNSTEARVIERKEASVEVKPKVAEQVVKTEGYADLVNAMMKETA